MTRDPFKAVKEVPWRQSLRTQLMLGFGTLVAALMLAVFVTAFVAAQRRVVADAEARTRYEARQSTERLKAAMASVQITGDGMARLFRELPLDRRQLATAMDQMVAADASAMGGLLALEPGVLADGAPMAWYAGGERGIGDRDLYVEGLDVAAQGWYRRTLAASAPWWSDPYFNDTAGGVWMTTLNMPLHDRAGRTVGMIGLDVPVRWLSELLDPLRRIPGQRPSLVAPGGMLAVHPDAGIALNNTLAEHIARNHRPDLLPIEAARQRGEALEYTHTVAATGETRYSVLEPIGDSGWSLHLALSHTAILADLRRVALVLGSAALLTVIVVSLLVRRVARRITVPLSELTTSAGHFALGEYDWPVPHDQRGDEVGVMARALERARDSIRFQLGEIADMAAESQKLQSELQIASDIQQAMLPASHSYDAGGSHLELAGVLEPAKSVGGDFFDFFVRDGEVLWFVIGDVSDKGVPAALFMARTMTVLEVAARAGYAPDRALREAARFLQGGNDTCMFATVLCGTLALRTGEVTLASAAHEPPVLLRADGSREFLQVPTTGPLGIDVADDYPLWRGQMRPGDTLLGYTDGVTEEFRDDEAFGAERLLAGLDPVRDASGQGRALVAAVHAFAGSVQSDDITVLAIRWLRKA